MLVSLLAAGWFLWRARVTYPGDVATAGASVPPKPSVADDGAGPTGAPPPSPQSSGSRTPARRSQPSERPSADQAAPPPPRTVDPTMRGGANLDLSEADTRVTRTRTSPGHAGPAEPEADVPPSSPPPIVPITDPSAEATEPLVRRRRPAPEWLSDRDSEQDGDTTEPLVWPRDSPPDN
jgi:hypothetical protein